MSQRPQAVSGQFPRDKSFDSSLALLSEGYTFVSKRCHRYQSDVFETRLLLQKVICTLGEDAAKMFYTPERFTRVDAMPKTAVRLLQDEGSVQLLDAEAHHHRKQMFMTLMTPSNITKLTDMVAEQWHNRMARWQHSEKVKLHAEVQEVLCRAACNWAAIPLLEVEAEARTREFAAMLNGAGAVGPRNWRAQQLRTHTEAWARDLIAQVRAHELTAPEESALHVMAWHRDLEGELLDEAVAAVELLNVLRPIVAIARFITFAAVALYEHPEMRQRLRHGDERYVEQFTQEVRRYYPFFPVVGGRVRQEFEWRDHYFARGTWVLLDIYGTNHDARIWENPDSFQPERFREWEGSPFNFIPQGGGDFDTGHRCAGEWLTIAVMKVALRLLTAEMRYEVPKHNLSIPLSKMPALPRSGFVIQQVRPS
jgi:fatty-acid peroxygenase